MTTTIPLATGVTDYQPGERDLARRVQRAVRGFPVRRLELAGRRPAAVALTLLPDDNGQTCFVLTSIPESDRPVLSIPVFDDYVHSPTAAMVYQLFELAIRGRVVRVAHYEQPRFAWR